MSYEPFDSDDNLLVPLNGLEEKIIMGVGLSFLSLGIVGVGYLGYLGISELSSYLF